MERWRQGLGRDPSASGQVTIMLAYPARPRLVGRQLRFILIPKPQAFAASSESLAQGERAAQGLSLVPLLALIRR